MCDHKSCGAPLTSKGVERVCARDQDTRERDLCCCGRHASRLHDIATGAPARGVEWHFAKVFPIINIEGKYTKPRAFIVGLSPNTFVGQLSLVGANLVERIFYSVPLDGLNKKQVLLPQRYNYVTPIGQVCSWEGVKLMILRILKAAHRKGRRESRKSSARLLRQHLS